VTSVVVRGPDSVAVFDPDDGGRLVSFSVSGHELLVPHGADMWHSGNFVIAPWTGRLRDAQLQFGGASYAFSANNGPHALHGLVTDWPWKVTGEGELTADLPPVWPWRGRVVQTTRLFEGGAEFGIELHADEAMPAAVGWHPWFARRVGGAELKLEVAPAHMWANDEAGLPTGELEEPAPHPWDYCFRDLAADPVITWPGILALTVSSDCTDWVIYDAEDAGVCVEPWTDPPNSVNMPLARVVTPADPLRATMTWRWRLG
jgi:aldose 1-epimerase